MCSKSTIDNVKKPKSELRVTVSQVIPVLIKNLMLLSFGMTVGCTTILIPSLSDSNSRETIHLDQEQISWIGSINTLCLPLACLMSGIISQAIGRKLTMQSSCVLIITAWIILRFATNVWQIYVALGIFGIAGGVLESPVVTYATEVSQPHLRGSLLSLSPGFVTLGIFLEFLLGSLFHWRIVALYSAVVSFIGLILMCFIPESPYWLVLKNNISKAKRSLAWLRGWTEENDIEEEFQEIVKNCNKEEKLSVPKQGKFSEYLKREFLHAFLLCSFLFLFYNFSGLITIQVYAVQIFKTLEVPIDEYYATVIFGLTQCLACFLCAVVVSHTGRRVFTFFTIAVAEVCFSIVAMFAYLTNRKYLFAENDVYETCIDEYKLLPLVGMLLGAFMLNGGLRTLPWVFSAEVFNSKTRAVGVGALAALQYCMAFGSTKTFLKVVTDITLYGIFWIYAVIGLISLIILYFWLPETEGKLLQEITDHFSGRKKLENKVKRKMQVV